MAQGKPFPPEFRAEAVGLYRMGGRTLAETAREIGVSDWTLARWVRQADIDEGKAEGLTSEERDELNRLRRECRILKEERDLKKGRAFLRPGDGW